MVIVSRTHKRQSCSFQDICSTPYEEAQSQIKDLVAVDSVMVEVRADLADSVVGWVVDA